MRAVHSWAPVVIGLFVGFGPTATKFNFRGDVVRPTAQQFPAQFLHLSIHCGALCLCRPSLASRPGA